MNLSLAKSFRELGTIAGTGSAAWQTLVVLLVLLGLAIKFSHRKQFIN